MTRPVKWIRHRTAARLVGRYFQTSFGPRVKLEDVEINDAFSAVEMVKAVRRRGMWAFVESTSRCVHFWHDGRRDPLELAYIFGHELGHIHGRKERGAMKEEQRANEYGRIAAMALAKVLGRRVRFPPEDSL